MIVLENLLEKETSVYTIRDSSGIMIANISNISADNIIKNSKGHFEYKTYKKDGKRVVFIIEEDYKLGDIDKYRIELFIWKGYRLLHE